MDFLSARLRFAMFIAGDLRLRGMAPSPSHPEVPSGPERDGGSSPLGLARRKEIFRSILHRVKGIRFYAFTALFAVGIVPLIVLALVLDANLRQSAIDDASAHLTVVTNEAGERVAEIMEGIEKDLASLRFNPVVGNPSSNVTAWRAEMDRLLRNFPEFHDLAYYTPAGTLVSFSGVAPDDPAPVRDLSNWFEAAASTGETTVSPPTSRSGTDGLFVVAYLPIRTGQGIEPSSGVLRATIRLDRIIQMLTEVDLGKAGQLILIDETGLVLHHPERKARFQQFPFPEIWEKWKHEVAGRCEMENARWMHVGRYIPATQSALRGNWYLVGLISENEVLSVLSTARESAGIVLGGTLLLVVGGVFFLLRHLCDPLAPLVQAARDVAAQRWDRVCLPLDGPREIRDVAGSFNQMAAAIRSHQDDLESKVADRTKELKGNRSELSKVNAQLGAALESSLEGILVISHRGEILTLNRRFTEFFGVTELEEATAEAIGILIRSRVEDARAFRGFDADLCEAGSKLIDGRRETEWNIALPKERFLRVYSTPVTGPLGQVFGRLWVFQDVTETRNLERGLREAQKLEAVGRLAGGIAHDFNNLLAGMIGNMTLIEPALQGNAEAFEALQTAQLAAGRASDLVRQVLGVARKSFLNLASCEASPIVAEVASFVRRGFDPRIIVSLSAADCPCRIRVDSSQLHQVLMNLAVNARDAMSERNGGRLTFSVNRVELTEAEAEVIHPRMARAGRFIRIDVSDTGGGIPPEVVERMFEPFFTTKAPGKGTGLGLATSAGIVAQHEGWLTCTTEIGQGTTFHVFLPEDLSVPEVEPVVIPFSREPVRRGAGETVLLIDDDTMVRTVNERFLKHSGFRTLTAVDGEDGLRRYQEHATEIDLVLLDLTMPNLSGPEAFQQLRRWNPTLPVIIYTGYVVDADQFAIDNGSRPSAILTKPLQLAKLSEKVRQVLDEAHPVDLPLAA